jgi:hypothetical protein
MAADLAALKGHPRLQIDGPILEMGRQPIKRRHLRFAGIKANMKLKGLQTLHD